MTNSIQFDSTEILTSAYIPQYVKHESAPTRVINALQLAREDGAVLISEKRDVKIITLRGTLIAATQNALDAAIDSFKELLSRKEKNLDVSWNGSTRRYVATCTSHEFDRDHYHTNAVPWTAEFVVFSGEGKDTTVTTALNANSLTSFPTPATDSFTMAGSKPARPVITLDVDGVGSGCRGMEYMNVDTGEKMQITRLKTWGGGSGKNIIIDCAAKKVTENLDASVYSEGAFYGVFPTFKIGTNNVKITLGKLVCQASGDPEDLSKITTSLSTTADAVRLAQGFSVPYTDNTFSAVSLALKKTGTPGGVLTIRIETDNGGKPSGTLVDANATVVVAAASLSTGYTYHTVNLTGLFTLTANTKYWIVISGASVDGSNRYDWGMASESIYYYPRGASMSSTDSGATYLTAGDYFGFRMLYGGTSPSSTLLHTVEYTKTYL